MLKCLMLILVAVITLGTFACGSDSARKIVFNYKPEGWDFSKFDWERSPEWITTDVCKCTDYTILTTNVDEYGIILLYEYSDQIPPVFEDKTDIGTALIEFTTQSDSTSYLMYMETGTYELLEKDNTYIDGHIASYLKLWHGNTEAYQIFVCWIAEDNFYYLSAGYDIDSESEVMAIIDGITID